MAIINQPFQGQLGDLLIQELDNKYASFIVFSAFAKNSGVLRLKSALQSHKDNGGSITAFIGIDLDGTSYEALLNLFSLCDNLYVIHSESFSTTYHSKIYLLEGPDKAWCAVGSNNLTGGGLWTNFESCSIEQYTLPQDLEKLDNIHLIANKYMEETYECSTRISSKEDIDNLCHSVLRTSHVEQLKNQDKRKPRCLGQKRSQCRYWLQLISPLAIKQNM